MRPGRSPEALREVLSGLQLRAQELSDDTLSSAITASQRALDEWEKSLTSLRHHEQQHERAASVERRARDRLRLVLEVVNKLSDHGEVILESAGPGSCAQRSTPARPTSSGVSRATLTVRLLGGFELHFDERPVREWRGRRAVSILQFLVLNRRHAVCRDVLIDAIWPEIDTDRGRHRLHQGVYDLRSILGEADPGQSHIICVDGSYRLDPAMPVWVDAEEFETLATAAGQRQADNRHDDAFELCRCAEALYRGDLLSDAVEADWASAERNRLHARYTVLCNQLAELHAARGEHRCAVAVLDRVLGRDPWNEDSTRITMRCYAEMGHSSLALRAFQSCAQALDQELGVRPCAETQRLYREILAAPRTSGTVTALAPRTQSRPPSATAPAAASPSR